MIWQQINFSLKPLIKVQFLKPEQIMMRSKFYSSYGGELAQNEKGFNKLSVIMDNFNKSSLWK